MSNPNRPASHFDDGHISEDVRAALANQEPEIRAGVLRVADAKPDQREGGTGRPAVGTPPKRRSPNGR